MQPQLAGPKATTHYVDHAFNLKELLRPANAFAHPVQVVNDPDLTSSEKRAILASWASDVRAAKAASALPGGRRVAFEDIMDALRDLQRPVRKPYRPHYRRVLANRRPGVFGRRSQMSNDPHKPS